MISAGDFRNGLTIEIEDNVFQISMLSPERVLHSFVQSSKMSGTEAW